MTQLSQPMTASRSPHDFLYQSDLPWSLRCTSTLANTTRKDQDAYSRKSAVYMIRDTE